MTYRNRSLVRDKTVKFYVSDAEQAVIDRLVDRTGQQRQVLLRDLVMTAIERALQAESVSPTQ